MTHTFREKSCLHLVARSSDAALGSCRSQCDKGDTVLFLDDGVTQIIHFESFSVGSFENVTVCFSAVDLEARGLSGLADAVGALVLPDSDIVELVHAHPFCLTWK